MLLKSAMQCYDHIAMQIKNTSGRANIKSKIIIGIFIREGTKQDFDKSLTGRNRRESKIPFHYLVILSAQKYKNTFPVV